MTRTLIVEPEAEVEIAEAASWYEARSPGRGLEFLRAVEGSLEVVQRNHMSTKPHIGMSVERR